MSTPTAASTTAPQERQQALQAELQELLDVVGPSPLVDLLLERAFRLRATDIHLDPTETGLRVRLRVDGMLHDVLQVPPALMPPILSRLKLLAGMDITERRSAQDGHIRIQNLGSRRDIRVGSGPTINGERLVLRLMPDAADFGLRTLADLGLEPEQVKMVEGFLAASHGMLLVVGPVGSGKSTTIYTCLERVNKPTDSLVTIEDPVERRLPGVNQIQIDPRTNFHFVDALRGVLRQDPDVMLIGEIRDPETAKIGVRAGLTGVLVLSTLHATDTTSTLDVFREFGVPPLFIADSLRGVVSQRLLRSVCEKCAEPYVPNPAECAWLGVDPANLGSVNLRRGKGCENCFGTGYRGRTGIYEVLPFTQTIREAVMHGKSRGEIAELAIQEGMQTLEYTARRKILAGITTIDELHRVMTPEVDE